VTTPQQRRTLEKLQQAIRNKTLVPFVGAGVSMASSGLPSWTGLVESGINYLSSEHERMGIKSSEIDLLRSVAASGDTMTCMNKLQKLLARDEVEHWKSEEYAAWLEAAFGNPDVTDTGLLYRLTRLQPRVIATTNYDLLLEYHVITDGKSVTWERPYELRSLLRGGRGVAHLHGRFDQPQSIILSDSDYQRIVDDRDAFRVSQSLFESGTLLFIGVSPDGATDPHLSRLLENFSELTDTTHGEEYPHVLLHAGQVSPRNRARLRAKGVETLRYGDNYSDLEAFLASLEEPAEIVAALGEFERVTRNIALAASHADGIRAAALEIERWVYPELDIRVGYAELIDDPRISGRQLLRETVTFPGDSLCEFHYPISVAGWALAEGRAIAWPVERSRICDIPRMQRLGRFEDLRGRIEAEIRLAGSPIRDYIELDGLLEKIELGTALIGDLYQNWSNTLDEVVFSQFISLPVPRITAISNTGPPAPMGVFNIDTADDAASLASPTALKKLNIISDLVYSLYIQRR